MTDIREGLFYSKDHEWIRVDGELARLGVTDHAQREMNDILYAEVPVEGRVVSRGEVIAAVESVKTVADVYTPVSGEVVESNSMLEDSPQLINESPYDQGWICLIRLDSPSELDDLMDADAYSDYIGG